jgi:hypothetical protein
LPIHPTCPLLYPRHRSLPPLQLELLPSSSSSTSAPRLRIRPELLAHHDYKLAELPKSPNTASTSTTRLHEIITRIGEICFSPELAHVMLFPAEALQHTVHSRQPHFTPSYHDLCHDPLAVMHTMALLSELRDTTDIQNAAQFLAHFALATLPPPTVLTFRQPLHLCAWRIESPSRVLVYTGRDPDDALLLQTSPASFLPHKLSKILLDERSKRPIPSAIHLLRNDQDLTPDAIRDSLLHYAQTALTPHKERIVLAQRQPAPSASAITVQDHLLEEAITVLVSAPPKNHSEIALNQSPPWDKDHIDARFSPLTLYFRV